MEPITAAQREALSRLVLYVDPSTYLAGGVAVALRLEHRQSRDLDLFSPVIDPAGLAEKLTALEPSVRITSQGEGTLHVEVAGVPASWIRYRYPLLAEPEHLPGLPVPVASIPDLICMKLSAIAGRGAARDFWDLHAMLSAANVGLGEALRMFESKYATIDRGHVVKSLAYFGDADAAPLPDGLELERWASIKSEFLRWVPNL